MSRDWPERLFNGLLWTQGIYYAITGIWPLANIESFQAVTGRKTDHLVTGLESDHWLVMTVGVLVTAISIGLVTAAWRNRRPIECAVLAFSAAFGLAAIDIIYVSRDVLPPIYLADAAIELVLIVGWLVVFTTRVG